MFYNWLFAHKEIEWMLKVISYTNVYCFIHKPLPPFSLLQWCHFSIVISKTKMYLILVVILINWVRSTNTSFSLKHFVLCDVTFLFVSWSHTFFWTCYTVGCIMWKSLLHLNIKKSWHKNQIITQFFFFFFWKGIHGKSTNKYLKSWKLTNWTWMQLLRRDRYHTVW